MKQKLSLLFSALIITGCVEDYKSNDTNVDQLMRESFERVKATTSIKVEDLLPQNILVNRVEAYSGTVYKDPFLTPKVIESLFKEVEAEKEIAKENISLEVDPTRPVGYIPGPYESYELANFRMIGVFGHKNGQYSALVDIGEGRIITLNKGDYIGKNFGEIVRISETDMEVQEKYATSDGEDWYMQPAFINLEVK